MQGTSDILKMLLNLIEPQLIISLITLYLIIWFNKIGKIGERERILKDRLMGGTAAWPTLGSELGTFYVYMVRMKESRGFRYRLKKLFLWKVEGYTTIYMTPDELYPSAESKLPEFKEAMERELKIKVNFWKARNGSLVVSLEIPSVDPEECMSILSGEIFEIRE
ncbi:hypothetical protein [Candidatus Methanodesulfokora washburnensis]|jgi:hypothetical protein|uniref:Uncharacterized protein n=1 Tax=Candidatus Methanodesulfokora washburnensis TaxID=2478471 RepID=A0A429GL63_9CREN|nr:hypothetical protein [Candidatus Methanodesulfokores washburnensis]RSN74564.1 hypothetical protein D6D85_07880 [Candidatus Methanodesulfokores washburnensis]